MAGDRIDCVGRRRRCACLANAHPLSFCLCNCVSGIPVWLWAWGGASLEVCSQLVGLPRWSAHLCVQAHGCFEQDGSHRIFVEMTVIANLQVGVHAPSQRPLVARVRPIGCKWALAQAMQAGIAPAMSFGQRHRRHMPSATKSRTRTLASCTRPATERCRRPSQGSVGLAVPAVHRVLRDLCLRHCTIASCSEHTSESFALRLRGSQRHALFGHGRLPAGTPWR